MALVEEKPPEPEYDYQEFVTIHTVTDAEELPVIVSLLEATNIRYAIHGPETGAVFSLAAIGRGAGPCEIRVPPDQAEAARRLLRDAQEAGSGEEPAEG